MADRTLTKRQKRSDRMMAWCWVGSAAGCVLVEWAFYAWWREWFFLVRGGHWFAIAVSAYYFGRSSRRGSSDG